MSDIQKNIQNLVSNGKTKDALIKLSEFAASENDNDLENEILTLSARHSSLTRQERLGVITSANANIERNRINNSILNITINIIVSPVPSEAPSRPTPENNSDNEDKKIILFLASSPSNKAQLQLSKEYSLISTEIQDREHFDLKSKWAVTAEKFLDAVEDYQPYGLHFSGHGTNEQSGQDGIFLEDTQGTANLIETETLQRYFKMLHDHGINIEFVVFNSCYSEEQANAIKPFVNYVIGMNTAIDDTTAIRFASIFYKSYTKHQNIKLAFNKTMMLLEMEKRYGKDTPVLIRN